MPKRSFVVPLVRIVIGLIGAVCGLIVFRFVVSLTPNGLNVDPEYWYVAPGLAVVFMVFGAGSLIGLSESFLRK